MILLSRLVLGLTGLPEPVNVALAIFGVVAVGAGVVRRFWVVG